MKRRRFGDATWFERTAKCTILDGDYCTTHKRSAAICGPVAAEGSPEPPEAVSGALCGATVAPHYSVTPDGIYTYTRVGGTVRLSGVLSPPTITPLLGVLEPHVRPASISRALDPTMFSRATTAMFGVGHATKRMAKSMGEMFDELGIIPDEYIKHPDPPPAYLYR